jgi:hypothetical protein
MNIPGENVSIFLGQKEVIIYFSDPTIHSLIYTQSLALQRRSIMENGVARSVSKQGPGHQAFSEKHLSHQSSGVH